MDDACRTEEIASPQVLSVGKAPGTLTAPCDAIPTRITVIQYTPEKFERHDDVPVAKLAEYLEGHPGVVWIDVTGCANIAAFQTFVDDFGIPYLALEDVLNAPQRPKAEPFGDARFLIVRAIQSPGTVEMDQISLWIHKNVVWTFQHHAGDCFDAIRRRVSAPESQMRQRGADYLAYRIVDSCVDSFFPEAERLVDSLELLESDAVSHSDRKLLLQLHALKREIRVLERVILPLRDAIGSLTRDDALFAPETRPYVRDVYEHTQQLIEQSHLLGVLATDVGELAIGSLDVRLNTVMKVLAAITLVFMPLNFITSWYGMNFDHMPELAWAWAYPAVLVLVLVTGVGILLFLRRKGWTTPD